jgi:plasmid stability protein
MEVLVAQLIVRNLEDSVKLRLKDRARQHGRSLEEEARAILRAAAVGPVEQSGRLGSRLAARFGGEGLDQPIAEWKSRPPRPADL